MGGSIPKEFYKYAEHLYNSIEALQSLDVEYDVMIDVLANFIYNKYVAEQFYLEAIKELDRVDMPFDIYIAFLANAFESSFVFFNHEDQRIGQSIAMSAANMIAYYLQSESKELEKELKPRDTQKTFLDSMMYF